MRTDRGWISRSVRMGPRNKSEGDDSGNDGDTALYHHFTRASVSFSYPVSVTRIVSSKSPT
jgi:hypothetical protein